MTRAEAAQTLREIAYEIYGKLEEMEDILREVDLEELERAKVYWMAHIDGALLNIQEWRGGSSVSLIDTLAALEGGDEEEY